MNQRCRHGKFYKAECSRKARKKNFDSFRTSEFAEKPHPPVAAGVL
jgi:hypothetical protein